MISSNEIKKTTDINGIKKLLSNFNDLSKFAQDLLKARLHKIKENLQRKKRCCDKKEEKSIDEKILEVNKLLKLHYNECGTH